MNKSEAALKRTNTYFSELLLKKNASNMNAYEMNITEQNETRSYRSYTTQSSYTIPSRSCVNTSKLTNSISTQVFSLPSISYNQNRSSRRFAAIAQRTKFENYFIEEKHELIKMHNYINSNPKTPNDDSIKNLSNRIYRMSGVMKMVNSKLSEKILRNTNKAKETKEIILNNCIKKIISKVMKDNNANERPSNINLKKLKIKLNIGQSFKSKIRNSILTPQKNIKRIA